MPTEIQVFSLYVSREFIFRYKVGYLFYTYIYRFYQQQQQKKKTYLYLIHLFLWLVMLTLFLLYIVKMGLIAIDLMYYLLM